jgi:hypothetical protein
VQKIPHLVNLPALPPKSGFVAIAIRAKAQAQAAATLIPKEILLERAT